MRARFRLETDSRTELKVWDDPAVSGPVKTASVWQVREPLYQRASGRARRYAHRHAKLARELNLNGAGT